MSGKKDLIVGVMQSLIGKVDTKDLKAIENSFWQVSFNFSVEPITTTEVATADGSAFEKAQAFIELAVKKHTELRYRDWKDPENIDKD